MICTNDIYDSMMFIFDDTFDIKEIYDKYDKYDKYDR